MTNVTKTLSQTRYLYKPQLEYWIKNYICDSDDKNIAFFTLHFDKKQKTINSAKEHYRKILGAIFEQLYGKKWWRDKNILPGITIIEHGKRGFLHCHSIVNMKNNTVCDLKCVLDYIIQHDRRFKLAYHITDAFPIRNDSSYRAQKNHLLIQMPIKNINRVVRYILKEYDFMKNKIDFSNFFPHTLMFDKSLICSRS